MLDLEVDRPEDILQQIMRRIVDRGQEVILTNLDAVPVPSRKGVFNIGDYSAHDGYASMKLITKIIKQMRKTQGEKLAIQVFYGDHRDNDFNRLFNRVYDVCGPLSEFKNVYFYATGMDLYKPCVPNSTFDIIVCTNGATYLPMKNLTPFEKALAHFCADVKDLELDAFRQTAAELWRKFLSYRAAELKPGGMLAVLSPSAERSYRRMVTKPRARGSEVKETPFSLCDFQLELDAAWTRMHREYIIQPDEYKKAILPVAMRTDCEIMAPFDDTTFAPLQRLGLVPLFQDQVTLPCCFKAVWRERKREDDVDEWPLLAEKMVQAYKPLGEAAIRAALSPLMSEEEKGGLVDRLYGMVLDSLRQADPSRLRTDLIISRLLAQKD